MGRLTIGTKRYSSWSLRGWLAVHLAGLEVDEVVVPLQGGPSEAVRAATGGTTVPHLVHDGAELWESLAICEYCAEVQPALWPLAREARAHARSVSAEMHSGFAELRRTMPMSLYRDAAGSGRTAPVLADIARIEVLWDAARARFGAGGAFLYGAAPSMADVMFAPVVCRFATYRPALSEASWAYVEAVRAHPLMQRWYAEATAEPTDWFIAAMEQPA